MKKAKIVRIVISIILIIGLIALTIYIFPYFNKLKNLEYRQHFINKLQNMGFRGVMILIAIGALQVILAVLPGEILEIMAGIMYGPWFGLIICEIGITLGTVIVYFAVKMLGRNASLLINTEKYEEKFKVLKDPKRIEILMASFLLFPGLPKDFLAFVAPLTNVKFSRFLIINAIARIPSILTSTYFGGSIFSGNFKIALLIYILEGVLALIGVIFNKQITEKLEKRNV